MGAQQSSNSRNEIDEALHNFIRHGLIGERTGTLELFSSLNHSELEKISSIRYSKSASSSIQKHVIHKASASSLFPNEIPQIKDDSIVFTGFCTSGEKICLSDYSYSVFDRIPHSFYPVSFVHPQLTNFILLVAVDAKYLPDRRSGSALMGLNAFCIGCEKRIDDLVELLKHLQLPECLEPKKYMYLKNYITIARGGKLQVGDALPWKNNGGNNKRMFPDLIEDCQHSTVVDDRKASNNFLPWSDGQPDDQSLDDERNTEQNIFSNSDVTVVSVSSSMPPKKRIKNRYPQEEFSLISKMPIVGSKMDKYNAIVVPRGLLSRFGYKLVLLPSHNEQFDIPINGPSYDINISDALSAFLANYENSIDRNIIGFLVVQWILFADYEKLLLNSLCSIIANFSDKPVREITPDLLQILAQCRADKIKVVISTNSISVAMSDTLQQLCSSENDAIPPYIVVVSLHSNLQLFVIITDSAEGRRFIDNHTAVGDWQHNISSELLQITLSQITPLLHWSRLESALNSFDRFPNLNSVSNFSESNFYFKPGKEFPLKLGEKILAKILLSNTTSSISMFSDLQCIILKPDWMTLSHQIHNRFFSDLSGVIVASNNSDESISNCISSKRSTMFLTIAFAAESSQIQRRLDRASWLQLSNVMLLMVSASPTSYVDTFPSLIKDNVFHVNDLLPSEDTVSIEDINSNTSKTSISVDNRFETGCLLFIDKNSDTNEFLSRLSHLAFQYSAGLLEETSPNQPFAHLISLETKSILHKLLTDVDPAPFAIIRVPHQDAGMLFTTEIRNARDKLKLSSLFDVVYISDDSIDFSPKFAQIFKNLHHLSSTYKITVEDLSSMRCLIVYSGTMSGLELFPRNVGFLDLRCLSGFQMNRTFVERELMLIRGLPSLIANHCKVVASQAFYDCFTDNGVPSGQSIMKNSWKPKIEDSCQMSSNVKQEEHFAKIFSAYALVGMPNCACIDACVSFVSRFREEIIQNHVLQVVDSTLVDGILNSPAQPDSQLLKVDANAIASLFSSPLDLSQVSSEEAVSSPLFPALRHTDYPDSVTCLSTPSTVFHNAYHSCTECHDYRWGYPGDIDDQPASVHLFHFTSPCGKYLDIKFIIPKLHVNKFSYNEDKSIHSLKLFTSEFKNPQHLETHIFQITAGFPAQARLNLFHSLDGHNATQVVVVRDHEASTYAALWPAHVLMVLPVGFRKSGIGRIKCVTKELSYLNICREMQRMSLVLNREVDISTVWPFILLFNDDVVSVYRRNSTSKENPVSLASLIKEVETIPTITNVTVIGAKPYSSKAKVYTSSVTHAPIRDFEFINLFRAKDARFNKDRYQHIDLNFALQISELRGVSCRLNAYSVAKVFAVPCEERITPHVEFNTRSVILKGDIESPRIDATSNFILEKFLMHAGSEVFSHASLTHPVLCIDEYYNFGCSISTLCLSSCAIITESSRASALQQITFGGMLVDAEHARLNPSVFPNLKFLNEATMVIKASDSNISHKFICDMRLESTNWSFKLCDEYQTASTSAPIYFHIGHHIQYN